MLTILVDKITPRIDYTFDFIFSERGVSYNVITNSNDFEESEAPRFDYRTKSNENVSNLLYEIDIIQPKLEKKDDRLYIDNKNDLVASVFFILSRYEEYTEAKDMYNRFPFDKSILGKDWIELAVCDRWAIELIKELIPTYRYRVTNIQIQPTFDIDNTFAYRLKKGRRRLLSMLKDIATFNMRRIKERKSVLNGKSKDPYDTFNHIQEIAKKHIETKVFWLIGKWGKKDRNIGINISEHQSLIKEVSKTIDIGLHPSFASFNDLNIIEEEKQNLDAVLDKKTEDSRQHFLRFRLPSTYQQLVAVGFKNEYSMGFAEHVGFRAGTARVHNWFDLESNEITTLQIHPFVYMDGTLREYMQLNVEQSKKQIRKLYNEVFKYGGKFTFIWHNETIGDYGLWSGWKEVLNFTLTLKNE